MLTQEIINIPSWLRGGVDEPRKREIFEAGLITGLREKKGRYFTPNFERGLILDRLCEILRPASVLEIGTGRGMGSLVAAQASLKYGFCCKVTSLDIIPVHQKQPYAIEVEGKRTVYTESVQNIWNAHVPATVRERVEFVTGATPELLPAMVREGRKFGLVFIDAGHDALNVVSDLSFASMLLQEGGVILMDDFTPTDFVGIATCLVFTHCSRLFDTSIALQSDGVVYGPKSEEFGHGMVILCNPKGRFVLNRGCLWRWKMLRWILNRCVVENSFPISINKSQV